MIYRKSISLKDWTVAKLGEILTFKNGERPRSANKGIFPIYGANGVMGYSSKFLVDNDFTIVIGRIGTSGEVHLGMGKIWISDNAIYSTDYDPNKIYVPFIYYLLQFSKLSQFASKTTHPIITQSFLNAFTVVLPPLPEQKKTAEILGTVDEAIEKVEQAIERTQRLKRGLMQELLTKGIGHKEFKDTEIGRIPKEWEVVRLKKVGNIRYGLSQPPETATHGIPMIRATNIKGGKIIGDEVLRVNPESIPNSKNPYLKEGDVIVVRSGAYTGDIALVTRKWAGAIVGYDLIISPVRNMVIPEFLAHYLLSNSVQLYFASQRERSAQPHPNSRELGNTLISLPPLPEQKKIAEILSAVDQRLELLRKRKERLERVKKGLMEDLLTGKRRVKI